jgi:exodeoxyribonuclease III
LNKGIGVFSYSDYKFELIPEFNPQFRYIIPLRVTSKNKSFTLIAIWAMNNKENRDARYIGQIWLAINYYEKLLGDSTILIGDFNSNKIWDYKDRIGNHSDVVTKLNLQNINSVYHNYFKTEQGKEKHPTFFLQKKSSKPYHIDYCFVSEDIINKVKSVEIGKYEDWNLYSDHSPLIISFDHFLN